MPELFPESAVASISPRNAWIAKHDLRFHYCAEFDHGPELHPWTCAKGKEVWDAINDDGDDFVGFGRTKDDAITDLAIKLGLKLWNEEKPL